MSDNLSYFYLPFLHLCLIDSSAEVMEVDHDKQLVYCETLCVSSLTALSPGRVNGDASSSAAASLGLLGAVQPSDEQVAARLSAPVVTTQLDTRNIAFERLDTHKNPCVLCYRFSEICHLLQDVRGMNWINYRLLVVANNNNNEGSHLVVHVCYHKVKPQMD